MKKVQKIWGFALCVLGLCLFAKPMQVNADNVTSGTLGDNNGVRWTYDADTSTLTMTGADSGVNGADYESPFYEIRRSVKKIVVKDCTLYGSVDYLFAGLDNVQSITFDNFDTSYVTSMSYMFSLCLDLTVLDVSGFDTSNVTNMSYMFNECESVTDLNVSGFDTSNVTDMRFMFAECKSVTDLNVSGFDTGKVTDMCGMFEGCKNVAQLDVDSFDTSNVTNMSYMFDSCESVTDLNVSGFDTSNVTKMRHMFYYCKSVTALDVSNFDLSKTNSVDYMLSRCDKLGMIRTPKAMKSNHKIDLPATFFDSKMNKTTVITKDFCNDTLATEEKMKEQERQVRAFTERMYTIVLGRAAEEQGLNDWTARLMAQEIDGATLVDMFVNSDEFIGRNTSDEEYIKILYRAVLDREADADGLKMWKDMLADDWTRDYILEGLVLSTEFKNICDSYGIIAAFEPTAESQVRSFVKRMYTVVLNRRADAVGLNEWTQRLMNGSANGAQLADGFISSDEFVNRNLSNEKYVKVLYRAFFNREPDEGGFNVWMNELAKGASRREVMKGFVHSVEFSDLCAAYGIIRGEIQ